MAPQIGELLSEPLLQWACYHVEALQKLERYKRSWSLVNAISTATADRLLLIVPSHALLFVVPQTGELPTETFVTVGVLPRRSASGTRALQTLLVA